MQNGTSSGIGPGTPTGRGATAGVSGGRAVAGAAASWVSIVTVLVGFSTLGLLAAWGWIAFSAGQRDSSAVRRMVSTEKAWWSARRAAGTPEPGTARKKGKKKTSAAPAATGLVNGVTPVLDLKGSVKTAELREQNALLKEKLGAYFPADPYVIVDTANNHLFLKQGEKVLLDALCSTGSYSKLDSPDGRSWFFHTPRGQFRVQRKIKKPVWVKPDWAFVEENEPIPGARHPDRYEPYVMGDYALAFGNGYYIHGTLYRRLLGQSVTHGCVRLGDQELETVFNTAAIGMPIFIY